MESNKWVQKDEETELIRRHMQMAFVLLCEGRGCEHTATQFSESSRLAAIELHKQGWRQGRDGTILCRRCYLNGK